MTHVPLWLSQASGFRFSGLNQIPGIWNLEPEAPEVAIFNFESSLSRKCLGHWERPHLAGSAFSLAAKQSRAPEPARCSQWSSAA